MFFFLSRYFILFPREAVRFWESFFVVVINTLDHHWTIERFCCLWKIIGMRTRVDAKGSNSEPTSCQDKSNWQDPEQPREVQYHDEGRRRQDTDLAKYRSQPAHENPHIAKRPRAEFLCRRSEAWTIRPARQTTDWPIPIKRTTDTAKANDYWRKTHRLNSLSQFLKWLFYSNWK